MNSFDPLADVSTHTRAKYLAASMKHKHSREGGEVGVVVLADETLHLANDYDVAMWRIQALVETLRGVADKVRLLNPAGGEDLRLVQRLAHDVERALGREVAPEHPNPGFPVVVGMDGSVHAGRWHPDNDPYRAVGGGTRTRTCRHCGRVCGDMAGGSGNVNAAPVCHPNESGRPDCYHLIISGGHPAGRCDRGCHLDDRPLRIETEATP